MNAEEIIEGIIVTRAQLESHGLAPDCVAINPANLPEFLKLALSMTTVKSAGLLSPGTGANLLGLPIVTDITVPPGTIRLGKQGCCA